MRKLLTYSALICFTVLPLVVQCQFFNYKKYDIEIGAAEGDILQVQQDQNGAIWWVNDEYFTRFNGVTYKNIQYGKQAAGYQTAIPYIDNHGDLWICLIIGNKTEVYLHAENRWKLLTTFVTEAGEAVKSMYSTNVSGQPWVVLATDTRMLSWQKGEWGEIPLDKTTKIFKTEGAGDEVFASTDDGIFHIVHDKPPVHISVPQDFIREAVDLRVYDNMWSNGGEPQLWILGNGYIAQAYGNRFYLIEIFDNAQFRFKKLCYNGRGKLYLLSDSNHLWEFDTREKSYTRIEGPEKGGEIRETINQLYCDRENNLWMAVEDGVLKASSQNINFITKKQGIVSLPVQAVARMGDKILAAGPKGITVLEEGHVKQFLPFTHPQMKNSRQRIKKLVTDDEGNIWLLSNSQGFWHSKNGVDWEQYGVSTDIRVFTVGGDGNVYTVKSDGLNIATPGKTKRLANFPEGVKPLNISWYNNSLIILANKGVYKYNAGKWEKLKQENGKEFNEPAYALERVYQNLAIVGTSKGVYYLKDFNLVQYTTDTLWGNRAYYDIAITDNGSVWLASDTGVVMLDKKGPPKIFAYRGLKFKENTISPLIAGSNNEIWAIMRTGLMQYRPDYAGGTERKPLVQIVKIESHNISKSNFSLSSILKLESGDNDLTFYFDANSFVDEGKNKLLYKLDGFMNDWEEINNITSNNLSFKNLPPGEYVLNLQLINANGVPSDIVSSATIQIRKPFYNQWWFYAAVIASFFAVSFGIFYVYGQKKFEKDLILEVDKRSRELRSSEDRFRTLWENTSDALVLYNLKGDIILYNKAALEMLGKKENISGKKIYDLLDIRGSEMSKDVFKQNLDIQQLKPRFELRSRMDDVEAVLEFSNTYLLLPNEKTWVMLSIIRNITQRKQTEENLIRAKNEAEQASRVKSAFLATMSHEIRTPLNAIIGMSSVMSGTRLSDEQRNYVTAIKTSSDSLLSLVNNILDFSKIEAGMMMIEKTEVKPEECVVETLEILGNLANEKGVHLYYRIHPDVPVKIVSDKTRFRQVLINLVGNAIKFTEKGYVEIGIKPDGNNQLKISVTDTGIGIPREKINNLFKVFTQVDDSITRRYGGTGLGLAITEKLVNLLGGHIKVASQVGKGSQFTFTLKDFSLGKDSKRRGDTIQKFPGVKIAVLTGQVSLTNTFKTLNDERGIKTYFVDSFDELGPLLPAVNAVLVDSDSVAGETSAPAEMAEKNVVIIKRNLKELPGNVAKLMPQHSKSLINVPVTTEMYGQVLEKMLSQKQPEAKAVVEEVSSDKLGVIMPLEVLVVDDNKVNLMMMEVIMKNLGYIVDFANNGKEAVDLCSKKEYDLVFMDVQMPEMDGIEATSIIKKGHGEGLPAIVALTANAFPEDKQACLDAGMIDFLPKPVTLDTIKALIVKHFSKVNETV